MTRTWKSGRIMSLCAALALVAGGFAPATGSAATLGQKAGSDAAKAQVNANVGRTTAATKTRDVQRAPGDIELNLDGWTDEGLNYVKFTTSKIAWGVRFTLTPEQSPFTLTHVVSLIIASNEGEGLNPGEKIGFAILSDASGSGDPANAVEVYRQDDITIPEPGEGSAVFQLATPVTVSQGDLYIVTIDESTDGEGTAVPYFAVENGATNQHRSYWSTAANAGSGSTYALWETIEFSDGTHPDGNFIIRGLGHVADPGTPITGYDALPVDNALPVISNLNAVSAGSSTALTWTAPTLGEPTITTTAEHEPNDSPATAQAVGTNVEVRGAAKSSDGGSPGGFGDDPVEDWYSFTLTSTTPIQLDLDSFSNRDFDLLLYDVDGPFDSSSAVGTSGEAAGVAETIFAVLPPGTYYVAVTAYGEDVPVNTTYRLQITAAQKVLYYNIFCGTGDFAPSAATFFGTAGGDATSFTVTESMPGATYKITYVTGAAQSAASNGAAAGGGCDGNGPTVNTAKSKLKAKAGGSLNLTGSGFTSNMTVLINGQAPTGATITIKKNGTKAVVKPLGGITLVKGQTATVQVIGATGCTEFQTVVK